MTPDVFISHSSRDKAAADAVCAALEAAGVGCWIAPRDIPPGMEWSGAIIGALRQSRLLLLLFTAASNESPQVLREVERAVSLRQPIVTLKLEDAPLTPGMEYFLSVTHWLSATGAPVAAYLPDVVATVRAHLDHTAAAAAGAGDARAPSPGGAHTSALKTDDTPPTNLVAQLGEIVGREREIASACEMLSGAGGSAAAGPSAGTARLLTVTGMGGFGKTRLSQEVAHALHRERPAPFPDGVFAVEFAPVADPALVAQAVATALSVRTAGADGGGGVASLTAALREKRLLLVLDNCEHVLSAAAQLASALMRDCPGVRLLATSRERLGVGGERVLALTPLALPAGSSPEQVAASAAGGLFVRRAQAVQEGFALTDANAAAVAEICRRLDGIPLAIELAAARARALSPAQIAQRLDQRFRLLTGGGRDLLPHQQTLRALIDWSFDLLGETDRAILRRLAAFSGGWTLEAAEAICAGDGVEDWDVLDGLLSLVDKSLILAGGEDGDAAAAAAMRYRMLETIRQYAREKLDESGEAEATAERHARFFRAFAGSGEADLDALDADAANLRAALDWHAARGEMDGAAEMAVSLKEFWWKRGRVAEGRSLLAGLLERGDALGEATRAALLGAAGWLAHLQADYAAADACQTGSLDLCRAFGDAAGEADALNNLALSALAQGRADEAAALFEESLAVTERLGDDAKRAARLSNLGMLAAQGGRHDEARARLSEARDLYERLGDGAGAAACLCNLADLALRREEWDEAAALSEESLRLFRELSDAPGIAVSLANLAEAAVHAGDHKAAEAQTREALALCAAAGIRFLLPTLADLRARSFAVWGDAAESARWAAAAGQLHEALSAPSGDRAAAAITPEEVVARLLPA